MSKIGVGVGDEFPVDDSNNQNSNTGPGSSAPRSDQEEFEAWKRRRDAYRAQRDAWRAQKEEWRRRRDEWKDQARAWRDEAKAEAREWRDANGGDYYYDRGAYRYGRRFRGHFVPYGLMRVLGIVAVVALVIYAISHIGYILAGLAAIAVLFAAYHYFGHDPLDLPYGRGGHGDRDYTAPRHPSGNGNGNTPSTNGNSTPVTVVVTPPPPRDSAQ